jgi:hypothetical protein
MSDSKKYYRIASFVLIGIMVMSIGALAGWYAVLRMKGQTISFSDAARGFGFGTPSAGENGSTFDNMGGGGGGFAIGGGGGGFLGGGGGSLSGSAGGTDAGAAESGTGSGTSISGGTGTSSTGTLVFKTPRSWRATKTPVAGYEFATSGPLLYFAERATGYMFRADYASGEILRRTNTLKPKVYEAFVGQDGSALYRSVNETTNAIETFSGVIGSSTSPNVGTLMGLNLRNNLLAFDADPISKTVFFLSEDGGGYSGFTAPWTPGKSGKETKVFSSATSGWKLFALADGRLIIAQKPQDGAQGYAYEVRSGGRLEPIVRAAPGLTVLPQSGSNALVFGTSANGALTLYALTSTSTYQLPVKTVADKCVWSPYRPATRTSPATDLVVYCAVPEQVTSKNFLQNWYMGAVHTSDSWWRMNLTSGKSDQILSASTEGGFDVVDPIIDQGGSFIAFKNGVDGTLWVLRVVK